MATFEVPGADGCITLKAAADLSSYQFHGMAISAANTVTLAGAPGDLLVGVLMNKPTAAGDDARIFTLCGGVCVVNAGAAISTLGSPLTTDASGHFIAIADGTHSICLGYALETAGAAGDLIRMLYVGPFHETDSSYYLTGA